MFASDAPRSDTALPSQDVLGQVAPEQGQRLTAGSTPRAGPQVSKHRPCRLQVPDAVSWATCAPRFMWITAEGLTSHPRGALLPGCSEQGASRPPPGRTSGKTDPSRHPGSL